MGARMFVGKRAALSTLAVFAIAVSVLLSLGVLAHASGTGSSAGYVAPSISVNPQSQTVNLGDSVSITATPSGGTTPYSLTVYDNNVQLLAQYITGPYTYSYSPSTAGQHTVKFQIVDNNDQVASASSVITVPSAAQSTSQSTAPASALSATVDPQSSSPQFGQVEPIEVSISGGTPPYSVTATDSDSNWGAIGSATGVQAKYTLQYGSTVLGPDTIKFSVTDSGTGSSAQAITQIATVDVIPATATQPPSTTPATTPATPITATVTPPTTAIQLGQSDPITVYITGGTAPYSVTATLQDGTVLDTNPDVQSYYNLVYTPSAQGYDTITISIIDKNKNHASVVSTVEVDPSSNPGAPSTAPPGQQTSTLSATVTPTSGYGTVGSPTSLTVTPAGGTSGTYIIEIYDNGVYQKKATSSGAYTYTYTPTQAGTQNIAFVVYDGSTTTHYTQTATITVQQATQPSQSAAPKPTNDEAFSHCRGSGVCTTCDVYNSTKVTYDAKGNPVSGYMGTCTTCDYLHEQTYSCDIFQPYDSQRSTTTTQTAGYPAVTYTTHSTYQPDEYRINNASYAPYTTSGGQASGGVSNSICVNDGLIESTTTWPSHGRSPGGSSISLGGGSGYCSSTNNNELATTYSSSDAGSSQIALQQSQAQPSPTPQIINVLDQNAQNAQWLITCPSTPDPKNTAEYFSSAPKSFIAGNRCIANTAALNSNVILSVSSNWGLTQPASSQADVLGQHFAQGTIENLAYSGQTSDQGSQQSQISSGYDTQSYIFQQGPTSQQHGLWAWQAKYANLANANLGVLQQQESVDANVGGVYYVCTGYSTCDPSPVVCIWPYTYTESSAITSIQNTQIPIPTKLGSKTSDYFSVDGSTYPLTATTQLSGACIDLMYGNDATFDPLFLYACGTGWSQISRQGSISYQGQIYSNLNVYTNPQYPDTYFAAYGLGLAASGTGSGATTITAYGAVSVLPYILYNVSLPATYSNLNGVEQFLNLSLDTYSPHNYLNPASYLDQFPLYTDSGFFANYSSGSQPSVLTSYPSGLLSIAAPSSDAIDQGVSALLSTLDSQQACMIGFGGLFTNQKCTAQQSQIHTGFTPLGRYIQGRIIDPIYVAAAPNDYIYAINYTSSCNWLSLCFLKSSEAYLFVMRYIPAGDYNVSNDQPDAVGPATSAQTTTTPLVCEFGYCGTGTPSTTQSGPSDPGSAWASEWENPATGYWTNSTNEQSKNLYITNIYQLSDPTLYNFPLVNYFFGGVASSNGGTVSVNVPIAVGTDYGDDVYLLGLQDIAGHGFSMAGIVRNPQDGSISAVSATVTQPKVTNPSDNKQTNFIPSSPGEFAVSPGGQYVYVGNSSIGEIESYSTYKVDPLSGLRDPNTYFTFSGNIPLSYSNSSFNMNISAYLNSGGPFANALISNNKYFKDARAVNDIESNHHPIAISDSQGMLYVLDNWTFKVDGQPSSILMLRAFSENGIEVPINPAQADTLAPVNPQAVSTSPSITANPPVGWPAYGFPIAAYITLPDGSTQTYCAVGCDTTPQSGWLQGFGYYPIGPEIGPNGGTMSKGGTAQDLGMSTDFNGTSYLMAHVSENGNSYAELLAFHPTLVNYTKLSLGADAQYTCYTDMQAAGSASPQSSSEPQCVTLSGPEAAKLEATYPPLLGVPSSFSYVESQGSPVQYLSGPNALSSLFPNGVNSQQYATQAQKIANGNGFNGQQPSYSQKSIQSGSYLTTPGGASSVGAPSAIPVVYANSVVRGYVVVPYEVKYTINQAWEPNPVDLGSPCGAWFFPDQNQQSFDSYTYSVAPLTDSNFLNRTIEGGSIYAKYLQNDNYYIANISDQNTQLLPYLNINLFTNRVLGELYINQTISPQNAYNPLPAGAGGQYPLVLNATRQYDYLTNNYVQSFGSAQYPGYATQEAVPTSVNGADCGSSCPQNYYYSSDPVHYMPTNNIISYSNTISSQPLQLFSVFEFTTNLDNLVLDSSNNIKILGYNRLVYTYVDRFGNTYFMPLGVDLVNKTAITLSVNTVVSTDNPNETSITINGLAQSVTQLKTSPLPKDSLIDIYYDENINFYNTTSPLTSSADALGYYKWAGQCAFGATTKACSLADPLAAITQPGGFSEAQLVNFYTNYNSITQQTCAPEPSSLLQTPNLNECNIYGSFGLPAAQFNPNTNSYSYCNPEFLNGNGIFTTQLGLVGSVRTDANGGFSTTFTVCGTGAHRVIAEYYGNPPPEPNYVYQTPLSQSGGSYEFQQNLAQNGKSLATKTLEYGYTYAPTSTTAAVNIGNYALSMGEINAIEVTAFVGAVLAVMIAKGGKKKRPKSKARRRR
ncbi:MAG: hypothetical protein KGH60_00600 [Candidatus Micrarchaeota archaeon]|nr:hypothetical protein [Candidatus Micrarchaeota archaeon]